MFQHITAVYQSVAKPQLIRIEDADTGKDYDLHYIRAHQFELGTMAIGNNITGFVIDKKHDDLVINGLRAIGSIRYPDNAMKTHQEKFIPTVGKTIYTAKAAVVIVLKNPSAFLLKDLLALGPLDPKHTTWILSSLLNLASFYKLIELCHNGLSVDTVMISPSAHTAYPVGGWWYAKKTGDKMKALPRSSHAVAPHDMLKSKIADHRLDLECIRSIGRQCLGPSSLWSIPKPFADFLRLPAPSDPIKDYAAWEQVREKAWGPRRFLKLEVTAADVYR